LIIIKHCRETKEEGYGDKFSSLMLVARLFFFFFFFGFVLPTSLLSRGKIVICELHIYWSKECMVFMGLLGRGVKFKWKKRERVSINQSHAIYK
jgi:hypothetical protein